MYPIHIDRYKILQASLNLFFLFAEAAESTATMAGKTIEKSCPVARHEDFTLHHITHQQNHIESA